MDVKKLIELVKERREIYDARNTKFLNKDLVAASWKEIALELKTDENEVKAKWDNLRRNYTREKRKLLPSVTGSMEDETVIITWKFFKRLSFLDDVVIHKKSKKLSSDTLNTSNTGDSDLEGKLSSEEENADSRIVPGMSSTSREQQRNSAVVDKTYQENLENSSPEIEEDDSIMMFL